MPPRRGRRYLGPKSPQKCQLASWPRKFGQEAHHRPPYPPPREGAAGQITPIAQPAREGWQVWLRIWDRWCSSNAPFSVRHHVPGLEVGRVHGTSPHCCRRITARIAHRSYIVAATRAAEVKARRGGFGGQSALARPKRRFVKVCSVRVASSDSCSPIRRRTGCTELTRLSHSRALASQ